MTDQQCSTDRLDNWSTQLSRRGFRLPWPNGLRGRLPIAIDDALREVATLRSTETLAADPLDPIESSDVFLEILGRIARGFALAATERNAEAPR